MKEKRRKLLETLIRTVNFYGKEDPNKGKELRTMIEDYKMGRIQKETYFESVRNAETVQVGEIPLPEMPFETPDLSDIPLPDSMPSGILKRQSHLAVESKKVSDVTMNAPGHPPGHPPSKKVFVSFFIIKLSFILFCVFFYIKLQLNVKYLQRLVFLNIL